jgi:hypothetical protein
MRKLRTIQIWGGGEDAECYMTILKVSNFSNLIMGVGL